ncbi:hypothetical protein GCM10014713_54920 [Streptomyces purpureus]|uniref:Uncharacterized protein n=1 Tax=Streptomyces purpureus TaxID=1951 RepID=A0A918HCV9_9ACTN|nr:hypothetical protein GCM10014713_54920 [Streptomyces purpureus]
MLRRLRPLRRALRPASSALAATASTVTGRSGLSAYGSEAVASVSGIAVGMYGATPREVEETITAFTEGAYTRAPF